MSVNIPVPRPIVIYQVMVWAYHELLWAMTLTWLPFTTFTPVVHEITKVVPEYTSNRPEVVTGKKVIDAETPVSSPAIVVEFHVKVLICIPVKLAKTSDPVVGSWFAHLVVTVNVVVTDQSVIDHVTVSLYHVLLSTWICIRFPLFTVQVSPTLVQLIVRYPVAEPPVNVNRTGTATFNTPAV